MPIHTRRVLLGFLVFLVLSSAAACGPREDRVAPDAKVEDAETITGFQPVAAILEVSCATAPCHSAARGAGQLVLSADVARESLVDVPSSQLEGATLVIPGDPDGSYLMAKLRGDEGIRGTRMPIGRPPLSEEEMATISDWIADGAGE